MPTRKVLPHVINEIEKAGVLLSDITVIFALGSHRKHTKVEMRYLVGDDIYEKINCIDSNMEECVSLGITESGTPVEIFRPVVDADRRICLGNVEYHYFAGYSGGAKAIMPGVSTRNAIQANHSKMVEDASSTGRINGNPVRMDIDDVAKFITIDFIVNVVLDEKKQIIKAVAGNYIKAHRVACDFLDKIYKVPIDQLADIVIVSAGGYPKDINLYQAQKALDNAKYAVKDGGTIILVASCKEGLGENVFERWMTESISPEYMVEKIQHNFELGGHKAAAIAMVLNKCKVYLVSYLDKKFVKSIFLEAFDNVQSAFDEALKEVGDRPEIIILPYGGSTLPVVISQ